MTRLNKLVRFMKDQGFAQLIVSDPVAIDYLTDQLLSTDERLMVFLVDGGGEHRFFLNRLIPKADFNHPVEWYSDTDRPIERLARHIGPGKIGIDKNWPAHFLIDLLRQKPELHLGHASRLIDRLRQRKDETEIEAMKQASALNDIAMELLISEVRPGVTEKMLADRLADIYQELDTQGFSFEPIIGFGRNSADPHHRSDDTVLRDTGALVIDIGCRKDGFCSDMTRTIHLGEPDEEFSRVYEIVRAANLNAIAAVRPGVTFKSIDAAARRTIEQAGYGEYFIHRTGHSIGREVHEAGDVSSNNHQELEVGMIFSIEPGIYLPGRFGVRIEDLVVVTKDGAEVLNFADKKLRRI